MEQKRHGGLKVGPGASAIKYDLLTALTATALRSPPTAQTSLLRLSALLTARYNWRLEEVSIGHSDLARLWAVNDRTVKREMKRLISMGVVTCIRPGVRGRVGAYRLNYRRIYDLSRPCWADVGPDYEDRMCDVAGERTVVKVDFQPKARAIVPNATQQEPEIANGTWGAVRRRLKALYPDLYDSWFAQLSQESIGPDHLTLRAPNTFVCRYIETHFAASLAQAIEAEIPTPDGAPRQITLMS